MAHARRCVVLAIAWGAASCSGPAGAGDAALAASAFEPWTADRELRVGSVDDETYAFTRFRDVELGPEGRIYTLHVQEDLVRIFAPDGRLLGSFGGSGEGPGEFQRPRSLGWQADTLWVFQYPDYRFHHFSPDGEFLRSFTIPYELRSGPDQVSPPRAEGRLEDGAIHGASPTWATELAAGTTTHRFPVLLDLEGTVTDSLPPVAIGRDLWAVSDPDDPESLESYARQPFADGPLWSYAWGERAVVHVEREAADSREDARFTLIKLSFAGDTIFSREVAYEPIPVQPAEVDSLLADRAVSVAEWRPMNVTEGRARAWAEETFYEPSFRTPVEDLVVGRDGSIWIKETTLAETARWLVFDGGGGPVGRVELPTAFELMEADGERLWGMETDELDVPYLVRFRIREEAGPRRS